MCVFVCEGGVMQLERKSFFYYTHTHTRTLSSEVLRSCISKWLVLTRLCTHTHSHTHLRASLSLNWHLVWFLWSAAVLPVTVRSHSRTFNITHICLTYRFSLSLTTGPETRFKGIVQPNKKSFCHHLLAYFVPNLNDFHSFVKHRRYFEDLWKLNDTEHHWLSLHEQKHSRKNQTHRGLNEVRERWQKEHFWVNYPFKEVSRVDLSLDLSFSYG